MKPTLRISFAISTAYAIIAILMAWSFQAFDIPVMVCGAGVFFVTFAVCWLLFGLCGAASATDDAIDKASKQE